MNKRLKLAMLALLGFSSACSTVKNAPKDNTRKKGDSEVVERHDSIKHQSFIVMYGVRKPTSDQQPVAEVSDQTNGAVKAPEQHK